MQFNRNILYRFNTYKTVIYLVIIMSNISLIYSKDTDIYIDGGLFLNENIYHSFFTQLPGITNCCAIYDKTNGIAWSAYLGGELKYKTPLFGNPWITNPWRLTFGVSLSNISAEYKKNVNIGNYISGNSVTPEIVEHIIDPKIILLMPEVGIAIYPFSKIPLSLNPSIKIGIPVQKSVHQIETLLQPSEANFETGTKTRNDITTTIPDMSMLFAVSLGVRYELLKFKNYTIMPEVLIDYGLNNLVTFNNDNFNWKTYSLKAGVVLSYNVQEKELAPPLPPPYPEIKMPEMKALTFDFALELFSNNHSLSNGDTIIYNIDETKKYKVFKIVPRMFFNKDSESMSVQSTKCDNPFQAQYFVLNAICDYLKSNPAINVSIEVSSTNDEAPEISNNRMKQVQDYLYNIGIDKQRISINSTIYDIKHFKYPELADEYRNIQFQLSDNVTLIPISSDTVLVNKISQEIELGVNPKINAVAGLNSFSGEILNSGKKIYDLKNSKVKYKIENIDGISKLSINANATDKNGVTKTATYNLYTKSNININTIQENWTLQNNTTNSDSNYTEYILGYCEFDKSQFYAIDRNAIEQTRRAFNDGKHITILPLVDNLGTEEYNINLANQRAKNALKLLGIEGERVTIESPKTFYFDNNNPVGRTMNRSVIIIIK